ncbi:hypothetical protein A2863_02745 [Candidatus Woesebacteria bacterium RIFCSPHIGHO2_01_FULL_38_9b]|uniref:Nudix hydrolase domain-containing protein n=1 Tax=Candidatus Woesebacteria bacterium RIFCSPHIGHO2_01_FULL_38_9b TaxID=1802493 RepID=A0A1F7Y2V1_9BACT|nr:MAG: hypothetical protein A2863_02745 [Candidatus Woesebacteria bacterium RIFCSPHIGHO2_01_FULL_38_9b]
MRREFSSGGVVFKKLQNSKSPSSLRLRRTSKTLWLLAKSAPSKEFPRSFWRLPKGWLDDEEGGKKTGPLARGDRKATEDEIQNAALREVRGEGGVQAKIIEKLGTERYFFTVNGEKILKFVTFYLMEWIEDIPEGPGFETEKVEWLDYDKARKKLTHSGEKKILDKAKQVLDSGLQATLV